MYQEYWGLKEKPFENTPDPRFLYYSHEHEEAISRMLYAVTERKGAAMLTGEYGCGKTLMSRLLFEKLPEDKYEIGLITNPALKPAELLNEICFQINIKLSAESSKEKILQKLNDHLYQNLKTEKDAVIVIDEAQTIRDPMTFEELRLLLNFQLNNRFLMSIILIGQPELKDMINKMKQLSQRISIKYHLNPLSRKDTTKYIIHRLKIAGREDKTFTEKAIYRIWENSEGIPRLINNLCDMSLLVAFNKEMKGVDESVALEVIKEFLE